MAMNEKHTAENGTFEENIWEPMQSGWVPLSECPFCNSLEKAERIREMCKGFFVGDYPFGNMNAKYCPFCGKKLENIPHIEKEILFMKRNSKKEDGIEF